ncbi:MAG: DUF6382 domain-containing protein [Lachnospiraceae bacterium]|jgi:hypothetical protein
METTKVYSSYHDARKNYLVVLCRADADVRNAYQYRMITANRIEGLLSCSLRQIDADTFLYADVTGKRSLSALRPGTMTGRLAAKLLTEAVQTLGGLSRYLLERACLQLSPELIFYDLSEENFVFFYDPGRPKPDGLPALIRYLKESLQGSDKKTVRALLTLLEMTKDENAILREQDVQRIFAQTGGQALGEEAFDFEELRAIAREKPAPEEDPIRPRQEADPCASCRKKDIGFCADPGDGRAYSPKLTQENTEKRVEMASAESGGRGKKGALFLFLAAFITAIAGKILPVEQAQLRSFLCAAAFLALMGLLLAIYTRVRAGKEMPAKEKVPQASD